MLSSLHIENVAVIERADVDFGPGFNVLTGETGAGKSIVIDSIDAVLGGRSSREIVRHGEERALISAVFTDYDAGSWFEDNDIEPSDELILQRRVGSDGKSACRVNGVPVTVQQLRALGAMLLDIHGQNDGRQLLDEARHLEYLDGFGVDKALKQAYAAAYGEYRRIKGEIDRLSIDELEKARLTDSLSAAVEELSAAALRPGEEEELSARRELMRNSEKLTECLEAAYGALYEGDANAIGLVSDAQHYVDSGAAYAQELAEAGKSIGDARFLLEDAAERINDLRASLDFSAAEYGETENRISLIRRLRRKYSCDDEEALLALLAEDEKSLSEISSADDLIAQLEKELERAAQVTVEAGKALRRGRKAAADVLAGRIESELKYLNMPSVRFRVEMAEKTGKRPFDATGMDDVRFLMSANAGEEPGRISKIASGGELSRIMLAMKGVFAEGDRVQTLIFDEIDAGVSGIAAQRVGEKMSLLSAKKQLICISHLPQIAALADTHFRISKSESGGRTYTAVEEMDRAGRLGELARLHGGDVVTETTLRSAEEQLAAAERFKAGAH